MQRVVETTVVARKKVTSFAPPEVYPDQTVSETVSYEDITDISGHDMAVIVRCEDCFWSIPNPEFIDLPEFPEVEMYTITSGTGKGATIYINSKICCNHPTHTHNGRHDGDKVDVNSYCHYGARKEDLEQVISPMRRAING